MRPLLIVQSSPTKQTAIDLAQAARERDFDVQDISFSLEREQAPRTLNRFPIFIYGSVALLRDWSSKYPNLSDWIWYDHQRLGPMCWKNYLGSHFLNSDGQRMTAEEFRLFADSSEEIWHVRPTLNDKNPAGGLYLSDDIKIQSLSADCDLWISKPKPIMDEVRVWIVGSQPVAASQYRANKKFVNRVNNAVTEQAMNCATFIATIFLPHEHCVMDLAKDYDGNWTVIEFNPIHGSGWYGADPGRILDAFILSYE